MLDSGDPLAYSPAAKSFHRSTNMPQATQNIFHPIQAAAIDLDGTLLDHDLKVSPENIAAVEELHANGVIIILASGRHHSSMLPYAKQLPCVDWIVSAQGSFTADRDINEVLYDSHLATEDATTIIDLGVRKEYSILIYAKSGIYTISTGEWVDYYGKLAGIPPILTTKEKVLQESIFKVVLVDTEERIDAALDWPEVLAWKHYRVRSLANLFEFGSSGTSKAHGLKPLLEKLNLQPSQLAAFGDAPNDIPMFEYAGCSIAMSSAWDSAKAAAHKVAPDGPQASSFARAVEMLKNRPR